VYIYRAGPEATKNTGRRKLRIVTCNERKTLSVFLPRVRARTRAGEPKAELKTLKTRRKIAGYVAGPRHGRNYRENEQGSRDSSSQLLERLSFRRAILPLSRPPLTFVNAQREAQASDLREQIFYHGHCYLGIDESSVLDYIIPVYERSFRRKLRESRRRSFGSDAKKVSSQ